jgi:hypothetical protein
MAAGPGEHSPALIPVAKKSGHAGKEAAAYSATVDIDFGERCIHGGSWTFAFSCLAASFIAFSI